MEIPKTVTHFTAPAKTNISNSNTTTKLNAAAMRACLIGI
jgi:hypothetical protein